MTYVLYEWADNPMFCPAASLLALAFANNTLKEDGVQCPEDLLTLKIPHFKEALVIQWKPELLETPIFHCQVNGVIFNSEP